MGYCLHHHNDIRTSDGSKESGERWWSALKNQITKYIINGENVNDWQNYTA